MGRSWVQGLVRAARWAGADTAAGRPRGPGSGPSGAGPPGHRHRAPESNHGPMMRDASAVGSSVRAAGGQWRKWRVPVMSIVPSAASTDGDRLGVAHRAARLGEGARRRPPGRPRPRRGTGRRRPRRTTAPAGRRRRRASRGPWRPPGGRRRRARSGRCPSRRAGGRGRARSRSTSRRGPGARRGRGRAARRRSGARRVAHVQVVGSSVTTSGVVTRTAPPAVRIEPVGDAAVGGTGSSDARRSSTSTRRFGFVARTSSASAVKAGATTISRKIEVSASAIARSTSRVSATTPPKALTGSASSAASQASSRVARSAAPHGLVCLTMTTPGPAQRPTERRRRRRVEDVVVRQRLALERRALDPEQAVVERRAGPSIAGRRLVRVLAVAQRLDLLERDGQGRRVRVVGRVEQAGVARTGPGSSAAIRAS